MENALKAIDGYLEAAAQSHVDNIITNVKEIIRTSLSVYVIGIHGLEYNDSNYDITGDVTYAGFTFDKDEAERAVLDAFVDGFSGYTWAHIDEPWSGNKNFVNDLREQAQLIVEEQAIDLYSVTYKHILDRVGAEAFKDMMPPVVFYEQVRPL